MNPDFGYKGPETDPSDEVRVPRLRQDPTEPQPEPDDELDELIKPIKTRPFA
jgi:hypothetical protein